MKRKLALICSLVLVASSLCACTSFSDDKTKSEISSTVSPEMIEMASELESLGSMDSDVVSQVEDNIATKVSYGALEEDQGEMLDGLVEEWAEVEPQIGTFKDYKDFSLVKAGKTYTATLTLAYTKRDVQLVYVIDAYDQSITAMNVEIVYSLGEKMSKAGLNTLMGISVVFIMLVLMSICIYAFNIIPYLQNKFNNKNKTEDKPTLEIKSREEELKPQDKTDDLELIAVIAAAIAASTGQSTDDFVVRSIRRR